MNLLKRYYRGKVLLIFLLTLFAEISSAQVYNDPSGTYNTCSGYFYDTGGPSGNYGNNQTIVTTFTATSGSCITVAFTNFSIEDGYDFLYAYDGTSTSAPLIGTYTGSMSGSNAPGCLIGTSGSITFKFVSDGSFNLDGWQAFISCSCPSTSTSPNQNCVDKTCFSSTVGATLSGAGSINDINTNNEGCFMFGEKNSSWYYITVATSGTLELNIFPTNVSDDCDFALWGPNPNCDPTNSPVKCSYSASGGFTGINSNYNLDGTVNSEGTSGDNWVDDLNVTAGQTYILMVSDYTQAGSFTADLGGSATYTCSPVCPPVHPTITANGSTTFCQGDSVKLTANSGYTSYSWSNGATTQSITVTNGGSYTVTVDSTGCPGTSAPVVVTVNPYPQPVISASGATTFCQGDSVTLSPGAGYNSYSWSNGATTQSITVYASGNYSVTVDSNGCSATSTPVPVTVKPGPHPNILVDGNNPFCQGDSLSLSTGTYSSYLWSNGATAQHVVVYSAGTYTVTVDSNGCSGTSAPVVVAVKPLPTPLITANGPTTFCQGDSVKLTTGSGYTTYLWPNGDTLQSSTITTSGNYTVTVDSNGCPGTSPPVAVTVNPNPNPVITASGPTTFCQGDSVILSGGNGYASYLWSNGATTQSTTVYSAGTYTLTVDSNGCSATSAPITVSINSNPSPTITASGPTSFCQGDSVTLSVTTGYGSYLWSNGATTSNITVNTAGNYSVTVTSGSCGGTSATDTVIVKNNPDPHITANGATTFCQGDSVVLSANTGYTSYSWSNGNTTQSITINIAGNYTVTVDSNGCSGVSSAPATVTVNSNPTPTITANGPTTFCQGDSVTLSASNGYNSYLWSNGDTTQSITVTSPGNYAVTVTDSNSCSGASASDSVSIKNNPSPTITANGPTTFCQGDSVVLSANTGYTSYSWSNGNTTQSITVTTPGNYIVTVDSNGCNGISSIDTVVVNNNPNPVINANGPITFCQGDSVTLSASAGYTSYLWSNGNTTQSITVNTAGNYTVTVDSSNSCSSTSASVPVLVNPLPSPSITANGPTTFCQGDSVILSAGSGYNSYLWSNGATTPSITITSPGNYTLTVDSNNCNGTTANPTTITVNSSPQPIITLNGSTMICRGDSVILNAPSGYTAYQWSNGATTSSITVSSSGSYNLTVTDTSGCSGSSTSPVIISVDTSIHAGFTANPVTGTAPLGVDFTNTSSGAIHYQWIFGDGTNDTITNPSHIYGETGTYTVTLIAVNNNGCIDTATYSFIQVNEQILFIVPNVFTPNGDGINDIFNVKASGITQFHGEIFNRWGEKLFEWNTIKGGWNGRTESGTTAPSGIYFYIINAEDYNGKKYHENGAFSLIR